MGKNERKTEALVRNKLTELGYYDSESITVEEQISDNPRIDGLLQKASKKGGKKGYPEFIISSSKEFSELLILIECKADISAHQSYERKKYSDFAVDGAIWYASNLTDKYNVISIGVSGQTEEELLITHHLHLKEESEYHEFLGGAILSFENYLDQFLKDPRKFQQDFFKILEYSQELNGLLHAKKVKESQRSLLISGILIALQNEAFVASFKKFSSAKQLSKYLVSTIVDELTDGSIPQSKIENLKHAYTFITTHTTLSSDKNFFIQLIESIDEKINSFIKTHKYFDTLGQFYIEFLRYANNDKGLGIVLTPPHITELFVEVAQVDKNSVLIDNCCGTGGFLISGMKKMIELANGDIRQINKIKKSQLLGIEFQDDIYALAVSNMIIHGDGKANVYHGDCFKLTKDIDKKGTIGFLNPPYKTKKSDKEEFEFVLNNLEMLEKNGICIAIIPMSCVLAQRGNRYELKKKILKNHTLEAVMSMPDGLFHNSNVGVVTCLAVLRAHVPHSDKRKTWFGYWKDDGYEKVKIKGRIDVKNKWSIIKKEWLESYFNKQEITGLSVMKHVKASDEWCAEAYMETDYSKLDIPMFEEEIKKYVAYKVLNGK